MEFAVHAPPCWHGDDFPFLGFHSISSRALAANRQAGEQQFGIITRPS